MSQLRFPGRPGRRFLTRVGGLLALAWAGALAALPSAAPAIDPATGVVALSPAQREADYWIARLPDPDRVLLDRAAIAEQNARMRAQDSALRDLRALPSPLPAAFVREQIAQLSSRPQRPLYDTQGAPIGGGRLDAWMDNLALPAVPAARPLRYGLVVRRAALRRFPTGERVFSRPGDTDIDRFQESALFPGDAVAVLHESRDGHWLFVASERYSAWIEKQAVALGSAEQVLGYAHRTPYRVVTGARAFTAYTPEQPQLSRLPLDMGVRVPVRADWPMQRAVNGQHPAAAYVIELPLRNADGSLSLVPALLPRSEDTAADYLPLTPRQLVRQAFKFLGERYGWGHDYEARDCSGFVSEVYRAFGVLMPRNTSAQAASPALDRRHLSTRDDAGARQAALRSLETGDLLYLPGHVMLALGRDRGFNYVIHDIAGGRWAGPDGRTVDAHLNSVVVTPLEPLLAGDGRRLADLITDIQRMRPRDPE